MELLQRSLSLSSIANLLSRRRVLMGAGVVMATASGVPLVQTTGRPVASQVRQSRRHRETEWLHPRRRDDRSGPHNLFAGQLGYDATGKRAGEPGDFTAQATQRFENLKSALTSVGAGFEHVAKLNNFLIDIAHLPLFRDVRNKYITGAPPARRLSRSRSLPVRTPCWKWKPSRWWR